ncbi:MAG: hypothetical protein ABIL06_16240 [Pseudomonadota bacterium]
MEKADEILSEIKGMKKSLFGEDGTGGMVRYIHDLQHTVCGNPNIAADNGLVGVVQEIRKSTEGLKTDVEVTKSGLARAWWWLGSISLSIILAAIYIIRTGMVE